MKKIIICIIAILTCFTLTACDNNANEDNNKDNTSNNKTTEEIVNLSNIESKIKSLGIDCKKTEVSYDMVGAKDGFKIVSGDYRIEVYKFNTSSESYKTAESSQKLTIDSMDYSFDAKVQNGYAYIIDDEFPQYSEVIKILNNLK